MPKLNWMVWLVIIFAIISIVAPNIIKKKYQDKFVELFQNKKFDELEELLNKKIVKYTFMPFNIEYLRLNIAFVKDDEKAINNQFEVFSKMPMNTKQKEDVYIKYFNYYVMIEDMERAKKAYELVQSLKNDNIKKNADITYDIFCEKGYKYLDEIKESADNATGEMKGYNSYLVSLMYDNKGDKENAEKYKEIAKSSLPGNNIEGSQDR